MKLGDKKQYSKKSSLRFNLEKCWYLKIAARFFHQRRKLDNLLLYFTSKTKISGLKKWSVNESLWGFGQLGNMNFKRDLYNWKDEEKVWIRYLRKNYKPAKLLSPDILWINRKMFKCVHRNGLNTKAVFVDRASRIDPIDWTARAYFQKRMQCNFTCISNCILPARYCARAIEDGLRFGNPAH